MNLYQTILAMERKESEERPADQVNIRIFTVLKIFLKITIAILFLTLNVRTTPCGGRRAASCGV